MTFKKYFHFSKRFCSTTITLLPFLGMLPMEGCLDSNPADPAVRYIAFGDSTTSGPTGRHYWVILSEKLGEKQEAFVNEGRGGESSAAGLDRLRTLLSEKRYPNARALLYWQGGAEVLKFIINRDPLLVFSPTDPRYPHRVEWNALLDRIQHQIEETIRLADQNHLTVYIATYYHLRENLKCKHSVLQILLPSQAENANVYVAQLNERIRAAARNQDAILVDVGARAEIILWNSANYYDCNHLNAKGNEIVSDMFLQAMTSGKN